MTKPYTTHIIPIRFISIDPTHRWSRSI